MQTSFLLTWAAKLQQRKYEPWTTIPLSLYQVLGRNLLCFKATTPLKLFQGIECIRSNFWKEVLLKWIHNKALIYEREDRFGDQCLWNNINVMYKNKSLYFKKWIEAHLDTVKDIWDNGDMIPFNQLCTKIGYSPSRFF